MKRFIKDCVQAAAAAIHFGVDVLVPMEIPYDPEQPASDREALDRLVFLVEDIRNILSSAAPMPCGVAAERPPEDLGVPLAASGGHSNFTESDLRRAGIAVRMYANDYIPPDEEDAWKDLAFKLINAADATP